MNFNRPIAEKDSLHPNLRDPATYRWMATLPKLGWAWEFLRRNPNYRAEYAAQRARTVEPATPLNSDLWPLIRFEDPDRDARQADVLWRREACSSVLPLSAIEDCASEPSRDLSIRAMKCRVTKVQEGEVCHVLLAEEGRSLQLEIRGSLSGASLVTPALPGRQHAANRVTAIRRLNDAVTHGELRPQLYPRDKRGPRLIKVVQALDGWLAGAHHREIAVSLFGANRVTSEWSNGDHLRDQVRRAIGYGRSLMESGFRRILG